MKPSPWLTVITATRNCRALVEQTARSIQCALPAVNWIVVDGASTDGTAQFLASVPELWSTFFSEPDTGIYSAWNKALRYIRTEWVLFLGAGDCLCSPTELAHLHELVSGLPASTVIAYGDVELTDEHGRRVGVYGKIEENTFASGRLSLPCHQGVLHRATLFSRGAQFDESYRIAADSKLLLQCMAAAPAVYLDAQVGTMNVEGVSNRPASQLEVLTELKRLNREMHIRIPLRHRFTIRATTHVKSFLHRYLPESLFFRVVDHYRLATGRPRYYRSHYDP